MRCLGVLLLSCCLCDSCFAAANIAIQATSIGSSWTGSTDIGPVFGMSDNAGISGPGFSGSDSLVYLNAFGGVEDPIPGTGLRRSNGSSIALRLQVTWPDVPDPNAVAPGFGFLEATGTLSIAHTINDPTDGGSRSFVANDIPAVAEIGYRASQRGRPGNYFFEPQVATIRATDVPAAVPEPNSLAIWLGIGIVSLVVYRWQRIVTSTYLRT